MIKQTHKQKSDEFLRFEENVRRILAVPKSEVDKQMAKYEREREEAGKRKRPAK